MRVGRRPCDGGRFLAARARLVSAPMFGTILVYRNDGGRPSAEVRLAGGDRIAVMLHAGGMQIDGFDAGGQRHVLFLGDVDTVVRILAAVTRGIGFRATPLDRLLGIVIKFATARDLAAAFTAASAALH